MACGRGERGIDWSLLPDVWFQSAPRLVAAENIGVRGRGRRGIVSIRSAACGRGEQRISGLYPMS